MLWSLHSFIFLGSLQRWLREGDTLKRRDEVVVDAKSVWWICEVVDELVYLGYRVASYYEESVWFFIHVGWWFVSRFELAKRDSEFDVGHRYGDSAIVICLGMDYLCFLLRAVDIGVGRGHGSFR